jgi:hypothetical protein
MMYNCVRVRYPSSLSSTAFTSEHNLLFDLASILRSRALFFLHPYPHIPPRIFYMFIYLIYMLRAPGTAAYFLAIIHCSSHGCDALLSCVCVQSPKKHTHTHSERLGWLCLHREVSPGLEGRRRRCAACAAASR